MDKQSLQFRISLVVVGTILLAISINFIIGIGWGMSTFDTACLTTQVFWGLGKYGDAVFLTHSIFIVLLIIFMNKLESSWKHVIVSVISIFIVSRILNMFGFLINIEYNSTLVMLLVFLINVITVNLAIYLMAKSQLVATPYDRFVMQFSSSSNRDLGHARLIVDVITFIFALFVIFGAKLDVPISIATLFIVLISGPIITIWGKILKF